MSTLGFLKPIGAKFATCPAVGVSLAAYAQGNTAGEGATSSTRSHSSYSISTRYLINGRAISPTIPTPCSRSATVFMSQGRGEVSA